MINRRGALGFGIGAAASLSLNHAAVAQTTPLPRLSARVTIGGISYDYREEAGTDAGSFVSKIGGFTQRCIRCDNPGLPLTVFFRPDWNSLRAEVVFELGRCFNATPANLGAYNVVISRGTQVLANIDVPQHFWFSRWRWQSSPRPVVGDVSALIGQNLLPPYERSAAAPTPQTSNSLTSLPPHLLALLRLRSTAASTSTVASSGTSAVYSIMGLAGIQSNMGQTGERPDIGLVTEHQAEYICTSSATALGTVRAQAEAAGTLPWHMRDENTGTPFDFRTYPKATWYSNQSTTKGTPYIKTAAGTGITIDSAHQPAVAYLPYLLTGDPYHLEDLQFQTNWNWGSLPTEYRPSVPQSRSFAWNLRSLAQAAKVTPADVPRWLLPQSYFAGMMLQVRQHFEEKYVNNPAPERALFRALCNINATRDEPNAPAGTWVDPWQDEFVAAVLGWVVSMGFSEWQTTYDWKIGSTLARTNNASGWIRARATPYRMIVRNGPTGQFAQNWAEAMNLSQAIGGLTYTDPNTWVTSDMTYLTYTRGALVYAQKLGVPGLDERVSWATQQLKAKSWKTAYKWRLGTGL